MTAYVDDMNAPFGRMVLCHLVADSTEELLRMARLIGVNTKWIQNMKKKKKKKRKPIHKIVHWEKNLMACGAQTLTKKLPWAMLWGQTTCKRCLAVQAKVLKKVMAERDA